MSDNQADLSRNLTFSQRHGYEPFPEPMRLEELSSGLRREIGNCIREFLLSKNEHGMEMFFATSSYKRFVERVIGNIMDCDQDEVSTEYEEPLGFFRKFTEEEKFHRLLDLIEIIVNDEFVEDSLSERIASLFDRHAAAYQLDTKQRPFQFYPRGSKEQGEATQQAIETIQTGGMEGAVTHLRNAVRHINAGEYSDSVVDSINAVESVARTIAPEANTLGKALTILKKKGLLTNSQLKAGFEKLYAYTNSEEGGRHALVFKDSSDIDLDEAMFMFGSCASFAAYLVSKQRQIEEK